MGKTRILFAEGNDERMMEAAVHLHEEGFVEPVLFGDCNQIMAIAKQKGKQLEGIEIMDPSNISNEIKEQMVMEMIHLRKGKWDQSMCREKLEHANYFTTMALQIGLVDGLLGGSTTTTADTLRPALQLIKTNPTSSLVLSCFLMVKDEKVFLFSDCSLNINPSADELVDITLQTVESANQLGIVPKVGILSYSTLGSGKGESVDKMREVAKRLKRMMLDFEVEGEIQVDAALSKETAALKAPNSTIAGNINVLIFPSLDAGNIGYKLVARLGGYEAIGPIVQGLNKPVNDLSRGCTSEEVYKMARITAMQVSERKHQNIQESLDRLSTRV